MNRVIKGAAAIAITASLMLTGCGNDTSTPPAGSGDITLKMSAWSIATTPEFQLLVDGFNAANPGIKVELMEYDAAEYNTLLTADLAAGSGPDIITQKEVKFTPVLVDGGQLLDVSDVKLPSGINGADSYKVDGKQYAIPYRQDIWVIYYNKALFEAAGVAEPDGSWTWDEYAATAKELTTNLRAAGNNEAYGIYQHGWQSIIQGFANAQVKDADILNGKFEQFDSYYARALDLQDSGAQIDFNTRQANQLTYQGEFGKQKAAMMPMGTWYVATLIAQQKDGKSDDFEWGFAPAPQYDASTTGLKNTPVTFGDPTGLGINAKVSDEKAAAAKKFLEYAASENAAKALAGIGITPALTSDAVVDAYFAVEGAPQDDLSSFAWSTKKVVAENPPHKNTATIQTILGDLHTAVMSESSTFEAELVTAQNRFKNEVGK